MATSVETYRANTKHVNSIGGLLKHGLCYRSGKFRITSAPKYGFAVALISVQWEIFVPRLYSFPRPFAVL